MSEENFKVPPENPPINGVANQNTPKKIVIEEPQKSPPAESEAHIQLKKPVFAHAWIEKGRAFFHNRWVQLIWRGVRRLFLFASAIVSLLWAFALWDSYRPKITVVPGPTLNAKFPFATAFIIQNQGALSIRNVSFDTTWTYADDPNQTRNANTGISLIPELKSLEQHVLGAPFQFNIPAIAAKTGTIQLPAGVETSPTPIEHHSLILWFDVTYDPEYFWKKTETLYFFGAWDRETNFQWFPSGHADIRTQVYDPILVQKWRDLNESIARHVPNHTNKTPEKTNSFRMNGSPGLPTNGGAGLHTN